MTERQICKLKTGTLELMLEKNIGTDLERRFAEEELERRGFDRSESEARYGVSGREDDSLNPWGSYAELSGSPGARTLSRACATKKVV